MSSLPPSPNALRPLRQVMRDMIGSVYVPSFFSAVAQQAITILLPLYALQFDGGAALAALMLGARGAGVMFADLPAGMLVSRFGDKWVMVAGLLLLIMVTAVAAFVSSPAALLVVSFGSGVGSGVWMMARLAYITDHIALTQRGRVISVMAGVQRAGALIGPVLAGVGVQLAGYPTTFMVCAGLYGLSLLGLLIAAKGERSVGAEHRVPVLQVISRHRRVFATAGVVMIVLQVARNARLWIIPVWGATLGLDEATIGLVFSAASAVDMLMFYPAGLMLDHLGRRVSLTPALLIMGLSIGMLPTTDSLAGYAVWAILSGLGNGFSTGAFMTLGADFSPRKGRGEFLGVWRLVGDMGAAGGPFLIGGLAQFGSIVMASACTGGLTAAGVLLLWWCVPETLRRTPDR